MNEPDSESPPMLEAEFNLKIRTTLTSPINGKKSKMTQINIFACVLNALRMI